MPLSPLPPARAYLNGFVLGFADRFRSEELKHEAAKVDATDSKVKPSGTGADSSSAGNGTVESDADTTPAVNVHSPFTLPAQMEPTGDAKAKGPAAPANAAVKAEPSDTLPHKQAGNGLFSMADAAAESSDPTTTDSRGNGDGMSSKLDVSDEVGDADGDDGANGDEQKDEEEGANDDDNEDDGDEGQGEGEGEGEGESEGESESGNESENEGESDGGDGGGSKTGSKAPKGSGPLVRTPPRLPRAQTTKPVATKPVTKPLHSDLSSSSSSSEEEEEAAPSSSESESESEPETRPGLRLVRRSLGRGQSSAPGSSGSDADSDAEEEVTVKPKTNKRSEADRGYTRSFARYDLSDEQGEADWERAADAAEAALEATADMEFAFAFDTEINEFDELDEAKDVPTQPRKAHERSPAEPASAALKRKTTRHSVPALVRPPMGRGGKIRSKPMGAFKLIALLASAMAALAFTVFLAVLPDASRVHLTSPAPVMRWAVSVKDAITTPLGLSATYTPGCQVIVPTCRNGRVAGHAPSAAQQPTRAVFFETQTVMFFFKGNSTGTATVGRCAEAARKYHELCENQKHEPVLTRFYDGNEPLCEFPPRDSISLPTHFEAMGYCNGEDACKRFAGLSDECSRFVSLPSPFDDPSLHTTADAALTTSEQTFADCLRLHFASNVTYLYRVRPPHPIKCVPSAGRRVKVNTEEGTYELVAKD